MATLISANADVSWAKSFPHVQLFQVMGNGHYLVIYKDTTSGNLYYRTSPDSGATWTAATVLPGSPTPTGLSTVDVINDVLYMWYSGTSIQLYTATFNDATNLFGAQTVYTYTFTGVTNYPALDTVYVSGVWHVTFSSTRGSARSICLFRTPGFDNTLNTTQQFVDLNYAHAGVTGLRIKAISGQLHIAWYDPATTKLMLAPVTLTANSYNYNTANLETAATISDTTTTFDLVEEMSGQQTFVLNQSTLLYSLARSGTNTYGQPVPLQGQIVSGQAPATLLNGNDLYVGFQTTINQSNGETYIAKRTSSKWTLPLVFAGGASTGFQYPILALNVGLYEDASNNLYFTGWQTSAAPLAPTNVAPVGNISTLTPTVTWQSNPGAPSDPTKSRQIQVYRVSDNNLMYDSGEVVGSTPSLGVPGGASLAYGIAYKVQVREKDSLSALGAGTWGPYSAFATFTPQQGATPAITKVTSGGTAYTSFPATIGAADIQAHVTYTQTNGDATNAYQLVLYAADNATVVASMAMTTLTPSIASGGSFDTIDWTPTGLTNGGTFYLSCKTADAVTGVISESAHVQLNVSFTAPSSVTGLTATVLSDVGQVQLNWTNPGGTTSVLIEWQPYTESGKALGWQQLGPSGQLWNQLITTNQAPQCKADYRVTAINSLGLKSTPTVVSGVLLNNALDYAGIWLNDINDPLNTRFYCGYVENWDSLKRDLIWDMVEWVPQGAQLPVQTFGLKSYWILGTSNALKVFLPSQETDAVGNVYYGADNRDMAISMANSHNVLTYRDRRFPVPIFVKFAQYEDQPNDDINTDMVLELHQTAYFGGLPVVGSLH